MATKVQLIGGKFQDSQGNILVNGYLEFQLNQDCSVVGSGNIGSGVVIRIQLDSQGNAASSTSTPAAANQFIWGTDVLLPVNAYYRVTGFTAAGQPAWGPNNQQVTGGPTFDLGAWIPNQVISWSPSIQSVLLETNGAKNGSQATLNLRSLDGSVAISDDGAGDINFQSITPPLANGSTYQARSASFNGTFYVSGGPVFSITSGGTSRVATQTDPASQEHSHNGAFDFGQAYAEGSQNVQVTNYLSTIGLLSDWKMRWSNYAPIGNTRYWVGLSTGAFLSSDGSAQLVDTFGSDVNGGDFIGFRFAPNLDATWKAYMGGFALGSSVVVDTGVSMTTTGSHVFELKPAGNVMKFIIDGVVVASVTIPALYLTNFNASQGGYGTNGTFRSMFLYDNYFLGSGGTLNDFSIAWHTFQLNL